MAFGDNRKSKFDLHSLVSSGAAQKREDALPIESLVPFSNGNQPFKMYDESRLADLAESIKTNGLLQPVVVRAIDGGKYEILAGHNRAEACKSIGMSEIKAVILEGLSEEQAQLVVVDTNLCQRQKLLPSERAAAYKMQQEALQKMGIKGTTSAVAEMYGENRKTIQRYVALNDLTPELMQLVDNEKIGINCATSFSKLPAKTQNAVAEYLSEAPETDADKLAERLKNAGTVSVNQIKSILETKPEKEKCDTKSQQQVIKLNAEEFSDISDMNPDYFADFLYFALQHDKLIDEFNACQLQNKYKQDIIEHAVTLFADTYLIEIYKKQRLSTSEFAKKIKSYHRWTASFGNGLAFEGTSSGIIVIFEGNGDFYKFEKRLTWTEVAKVAEQLIASDRYKAALKYSFATELYQSDYQFESNGDVTADDLIDESLAQNNNEVVDEKA